MENLKHSLVVSCQALDDEPLHSSFIMAKMALAAKVGGAKGIRANGIEDIQAIKKEVQLPIIGIVKQQYEHSDVYITATMKEIDALVGVQADIIAMDATIQTRPNKETIEEFFTKAKQKYPDQRWMADCSTLEEAIHADALGFDFIGTTLVGYTPQSRQDRIEADDFAIIKHILTAVQHPVIAEGNIDTPQKASRVLELGCYSVVVGSIITRPQIITKRFVDEIERERT